MKCPTIKLLDLQVTWLGLKVHAGCCHVAARMELLRVGNINLGRITSEFRLRTGKFETGCLANNTPASIATHEPFTFKGLITGLNGYYISGLLKVSHGKTALDLHPQSFRAACQHLFKLRHFRNQTGVRRARQAILPLCRVNIAIMKWNAGEVSCLTAGPLFAILVGVFKAFVYFKFLL